VAAALQDEANLNVYSSLVERELSASLAVPLVPFFNLTAPRHDMHRAHLCSYHKERVGLTLTPTLTPTLTLTLTLTLPRP